MIGSLNLRIKFKILPLGDNPMGKKLIILVLLVIFLPILVVVADLALTVNSVKAEDFDVQIGATKFNSDYSEAYVPVDIALPEAGFLPKSVVVDLILSSSQSTDEITVPTIVVNFGESKFLNVTIPLEISWSDLLDVGTSITVTITGSASPKLLGIEIPVNIDVPEESTTFTP